MAVLTLLLVHSFRAAKTESPRERLVAAEAGGDRVEETALLGLPELPGRRVPRETTTRHETADGALGGLDRPLGCRHQEPERRGHLAVPSEPALDRGVEAAEAG